MNFNLRMTVERSKRRSYFLSLVFITKCFSKNLLLRTRILSAIRVQWLPDVHEMRCFYRFSQSGIRIIGIIQESVCLGATCILIPEYLDFHSGYSAARSRIAGIYSGIYSYSGISQTNAP